MLKNLPALLKRSLHFCFFAAFFLSGTFLPAQEPAAGEEGAIAEMSGSLPGVIIWYRSNASGMALETIPSRLAALRSEYCLSVETVSRNYIPEFLLPFYDESYITELRILYEKGEESRRQWIFRDSRNLARLTAAGGGGLSGGERTDKDEERRPGFIEIRDSEGYLVREFRFEDDLSEWEFRYYYAEQVPMDNVLLRAETWFKEAPAEPSAELPAEPSAELVDQDPSEPEEDESADAAEEETPGSTPSFVLLFTDHYRYSRFGSLRAIERTIHKEAKLARTSFPRIKPEFPVGEELATQGIAYSSEFLLDINSPESAKVSYTLDNRGRILREIWKDEDGKVLGEYRNTWSADRLQSILWKSDDDERLIEYEYDSDGNRIVERNFRRGVLERSVKSRDGLETEEIYMNGRLILRAVWEKGMKISEERITRP